MPAHAPESATESASPAPRPVPQRPVAAAAPIRQKVRSDDELSPLLKNVIMGIVALLLLAGAAWFWYVWFGRDPKVVYSLDFPKSSGASAFYELIAPGRLLSVKNQHVTLMDATQQISLWSVPVPAGADDSYAAPRVIATTNDIWVAWSAQLMRIDRQSGAQKQLSIPDPIINIATGDHMILVLSGNSATNQVVTQFSLPDGATQTEEIGLSTRSNTPANPAEAVVVRESAAASAPAQDTSGLPGAVLTKNLSFQPRANLVRREMSFEDVPSPLFDAGANAIWFQTRLLERREIRREAMKKPAGKSVLDNPNVTASQGLDLAEEMANNAQRERTGGVDIVDVSRYQVTLYRLFAPAVPDWTGEVIGPPEIVPLKTVDLLVAGTSILAFDKNNKKLWDAKLTFPYSSGRDFEHTGPPCLETGDALYFADKGMLTRFDPSTGNVRWRLTSVGISAVQADDRGRLYLDTTTLGPDTIQYSQQISLHDRDLRVIMQVDPANGNILWRSDFPGSSYHCLVSGKFLYSSRAWQTQDALRLEEGPDTHFTFKLLQPADGKMIWNHVLDNKHFVKAEVQQNWILLQFEDQVAVMKFFSL
ncbi:MAG TPA: PQQ-binding-like beta-propeller repeat protein [Verrucomicrobiae bacterium]|nr:PQQ-binding-like beta-propeller repeat protein [Verrucomicrobiae bacterium]